MLWRLAWYRPIAGDDRRLSRRDGARAGCRRGGREIIPYGVLDRFRHAEPREPPPPRAVFTSNPLRGLDWLLDLWAARIAPAVPEAELHIYAGPAVYGGGGEAARRWRRSWPAPRRSPDTECAAIAPVGREALAECSPGARVMLYRGDPGETFCLALAEAQAMGVPAVVQPLGSRRRAGRRRRDRARRRERRRVRRGGDRRAARRRVVAALAPRRARAAARPELGRGRGPVRSADADDAAPAAGDGRAPPWRGGDFFRPARRRRCSAPASSSAC